MYVRIIPSSSYSVYYNCFNVALLTVHVLNNHLCIFERGNENQNKTKTHAFSFFLMILKNTNVVYNFMSYDVVWLDEQYNFWKM